MRFTVEYSKLLPPEVTLDASLTSAVTFKPYDPFLWMGFNCLKATEPLRRDSLLFTIQFPGNPSTKLIDL